MFYCDNCAKENGYPIGIGKSYGKCELCGALNDCSDISSNVLCAYKSNDCFNTTIETNKVISIEQAQQSAYMCCGENAPNLLIVTDVNWIQKRNDFLANVSHNGEASHFAIINVLEWFSKFANDKYKV